MTGSCVTDVGPESPLWLDFLEGAEHDIYHLPQYSEVEAARMQGQARAVIAQRGASSLLLPYLRRPLPDDRWDATSPYGYPGPIVRGPHGPEEIEGLLGDCLRDMAARGCVSAFLRSHPGINREWPTRFPGTEVKRVTGPTVVIDLSTSEQVRWSQTTSGHRNEINRALKRGYNCSHVPISDRLLEFAVLYRNNMTNISANKFYHFEDSYFEQLVSQMGPRLRLVVADSNGAMAAAALFTEEGPWIQYHLTATADRFRRDAPGKLLLHWMRENARGSDAKWLHLGGGRGGNDDSLLQFKAGFSPHRLTFHASGLILDEGAYRRLTDSDLLPDHGFFPAYRVAA